VFSEFEKTREEALVSYVIRLQRLRKTKRALVRISMLVFWDVTPCGLVSRYQRFRKQKHAVFIFTSALKMERVYRHLYCRENLKSHIQ
jgi:hypothetical protein